MTNNDNNNAEYSIKAQCWPYVKFPVCDYIFIKTYFTIYKDTYVQRYTY